MGQGIHFCLGARLGWMEAELALPAFLRRFRKIDLVPEELPTYGARLFSRDLSKFMLDVRA